MAKPKPISSILETTLKGLEIEVPIKTHSIMGAWKEIVGESLASQTQPRAIRNEILFIDVSHPTWMHQLQFLKTTLLEKVNRFLGETLIRDIRFKLGKITSAPSSPPEAPLWPLKELDKATLNQIDFLLQGIGDEETKKGVRSVLVKSAKLGHYRTK